MGSMPPGHPAGPPPLPPGVAAQMGQSPMHQIAGMVSAGAGPHPGMPGAAASPHGAVLEQGRAVEKVVQDMARMSPRFAPYADRIVNMLRAGLAEAAGGPPLGGQASPMASPGGESLRAPAGPGGGDFVG